LSTVAVNIVTGSDGASVISGGTGKKFTVVPLIDLVDILAVHPGIGGQIFNSSVLVKVEQLRERVTWPWLKWIAVDGGTAYCAVQCDIVRT
jgi:pentose-5-phosphate-3-epimerase